MNPARATHETGEKNTVVTVTGGGVNHDITGPHPRRNDAVRLQYQSVRYHDLLHDFFPRTALYHNRKPFLD